MLDVLFVLFVNALFFLGITAAVAGFVLIIVELFKNKHHAFKHHPTKDCVTC